MVSIKVVHITDSMDMSLSKLPEIVEHRGVWQASVHGVAKSGTWPHDWAPLPLKPALLYSVKLGPGAVQISSLFWLLSVRLNQQGELDSLWEENHEGTCCFLCVMTETIHPHCGSWFWYQWLIPVCLFFFPHTTKLGLQCPSENILEVSLELHLEGSECFTEILRH